MEFEWRRPCQPGAAPHPSFDTTKASHGRHGKPGGRAAVAARLPAGEPVRLGDGPTRP
ncbi:hypothetical protein BGLA2_360013 [Burkholderia gladioli]|nr:hypothetical protein BGLA2_360013 [Burkholderia gladioli]